MRIRLLLAAGVLMTASEVLAQSACGPACHANHGGHMGEGFGEPDGMPPNVSGGFRRQTDRQSLAYPSPSPRDTRNYRGRQSGYSAYNSPQSREHRMMQNPNFGVYDQPPRLYGDAQRQDHGHAHRGACRDMHGHSSGSMTRNRNRGGAERSYEIPRGRGSLPPNDQSFPNDLQPMEQPSLPSPFPMQSRVQRNRVPYSPPTASRSERLRNVPMNGERYLNI
ncbi:hypothetical protein [Planctomycetes bacterium K23_9]|uniref:Uncharacterized protein n=1 Tax=Stieleria marina TaxID=1930275 RepID=A0A517NXP7_9BACT|nr:hypothetical protein K239x_39070 [Planctomycetes bacterium K23_9]